MIVSWPKLRIRIAPLALAALGLAAHGVPGAAAQGMRFGAGIYYNGPDMLVSPRAVAEALRERGFSDITRPRFDGEAYIVEATNPAGLRTRLFVDARDGAIVGRQRLATPYYPGARPAPGYGWTEDDVRPGRLARAPEGLIPPGDIPGAPGRSPRFEAPPGVPPARETSPLGLNPDGRSRPAPSPRRQAKLNAPAKPAVPSAAPAAPSPTIDQNRGASEAPGPAEEARTAPAGNQPVTPAANQSEVAQTAEKPASRKEQAWKDPPSDETKRKVRVIDGATVVPGSGEAGAN